ncbi:hypothetical protein Droror1_Dr00001545 [Drosera rotundifolia]
MSPAAALKFQVLCCKILVNSYDERLRHSEISEVAVVPVSSIIYNRDDVAEAEVEKDVDGGDRDNVAEVKVNDENEEENQGNEDEDSDAMANKGEDNDDERILDVMKKRTKKGRKKQKSFNRESHRQSVEETEG